MKTIKTKLISGVLTPVDSKNNPVTLPDLGFGRRFDGDNNVWLIFESQQEADENTPVIEVVPTPGAAIQALLSASPEEIEQIKQMLK